MISLKRPMTCDLEHRYCCNLSSVRHSISGTLAPYRLPKTASDSALPRPAQCVLLKRPFQVEQNVSVFCLWHRSAPVKCAALDDTVGRAVIAEVARIAAWISVGL